MSDHEATRDAPPVGVAVAFTAAWAIGAWQAQTLGIWPAVGTTAVVLAIIGFWLEGRRLVERLRLEPQALVVGLAVGVLMTIGTYVVYPVAEALVPGMREEVVRLYAAFSGPGIGVVLLILPVVILSEEIVWRGVVYDVLASRFSWPVVILLGSLIYALAHAPIGALALTFACVCVGICWNAVRWWTDSLAAATVAHVLWDVVVLVVWPLVPVG